MFVDNKGYSGARCEGEHLKFGYQYFDDLYISLF
jgi:hypothetical protein